MPIKVILLVCVTVAAGFGDTVRLTNGDNMTGRLEKLEDGKLVLKTTYAGAVKIDCAEIAKVNDAASGCKGLVLKPIAKPAAASEDDEDDDSQAWPAPTA